MTATPSNDTYTYIGSDGQVREAQGVVVLAGGGGGTGGGGDASAANQATQITAEQAIRDRLGALSAPAAGTTNALLTALGAVQGATGDAAYSDGTGVAAGSVAALLKGAFVRLFGIGTTADTAYAGTGNASVIAALKGVYAGMVAATPAGTNKIGGVTEADGDNAALGAKADTAYAGTGSASVVAALKGLYALLAGTLNVSQAALPASTDRSGTATTTSGGLSVAANSARKFLVGQNIGTVSIGFNEQGGVAAIGTAGTYTVPAGSGFSISTNKLVNFIAASGTAAVSMTEG